jgi:hypothetical protein
MPDPILRGSRASREWRRRQQAAAHQTIIAREQASRSQGGPDAGKLTEDAKRPTITLKTGAVVDARQAVGEHQALETLLTNAPDEFQSLLALAQGRPADANPKHFQSLRAHTFLDWDDGRTITPLARDVLLNSFEMTREGPVIAPLRLQDAADLPAAEQAQGELDHQFKNFLARVQRRKGNGESRDP